MPLEGRDDLQRPGLSKLSLENDDGGNSALEWPEATYLGGHLPFLLEIEFNGDLRRTQLLDQALSAAKRIREIAVACAHRGFPIQWLRYTGAGSFGDAEHPLAPLNSVKVGRTVSGKTSAFRWIALTTANRLSLTFCSRPASGYPGVVFTADSDSPSSTPIPWQSGMIVTAPHHGSEDNKRVYTQFRRDSQGQFTVNWVRSDGNFKTRPGPSYLNQRDRFCTLCRSSDHAKQVVRFGLKSGRWIPSGSRVCSCR